MAYGLYILKDFLHAALQGAYSLALLAGPQRAAGVSSDVTYTWKLCCYLKKTATQVSMYIQLARPVLCDTQEARSPEEALQSAVQHQQESAGQCQRSQPSRPSTYFLPVPQTEAHACLWYSLVSQQPRTVGLHAPSMQPAYCSPGCSRVQAHLRHYLRHIAEWGISGWAH